LRPLRLKGAKRSGGEYAPFIAHGIREGMETVQEQEKRAVKTGYWPLFRFNPTLAKEGKNPFIIDARIHDGAIQEFLAGKNRFVALGKFLPEDSKMLRMQIEADYHKRHVLAQTIADLSPEAWGSRLMLPFRRRPWMKKNFQKPN
jgi:pyruvate-ferredoxin/flavodoxin oxidoreductase